MAELVTKYQQYAEYKKSVIEWVGDIPSHWEETPVFSCFDATSEKNLDGKETNVLSLSYGNIIKRDVDTNFGLLPESFNTYQIVGIGDIILRLTDLQNDKKSLRVGLAKEEGIITSAYLKLKPKEHLDSGFAYRLLHSYDTTKVYYGLGGGLRQSMKFEDFRRLPILVPPYEEQIQINRFLDYEVVRIDTLIDKQQTLIQLLKEKRQAVISHAVTKGLNPDVPMKESGVEWVETIPDHWKAYKLGYCANVGNGATPSRDNPNFWKNGSISWLNSTKINDVIIYNADQFITPLAKLKTSVHSVQKNDILMAITGEGQTRGRVAICKLDATINQHLACIRITDKELDYEYLYYWLNSNYTRIRFESSSAGSTKGAITCGNITSYPVLIPPKKEQQEIVEYLKEKNEVFDTLMDSAEQAIQLMQERRTALISAAVTGKIDVRVWVAPESDALSLSAS